MQPRGRVEMFLENPLGRFAATFSISTPPSLETISTGRAAARSSTIPRYNSRAMSQPSSTSTWRTTWPAGTGLDGDQALAEHASGRCDGFVGGTDQLHAVLFGIVLHGTLAAPPGMNLALTTATRPPSA